MIYSTVPTNWGAHKRRFVCGQYLFCIGVHLFSCASDPLYTPYLHPRWGNQPRSSEAFRVVHKYASSSHTQLLRSQGTPKWGISSRRLSAKRYLGEGSTTLRSISNTTNTRHRKEGSNPGVTTNEVTRKTQCFKCIRSS